MENINPAADINGESEAEMSLPRADSIPGITGVPTLLDVSLGSRRAAAEDGLFLSCKQIVTSLHRTETARLFKFQRASRRSVPTSMILFPANLRQDTKDHFGQPRLTSADFTEGIF